MLQQMIKFGVAGLTATAIHTCTLLFLVEKLGMEPVLASIPAFLMALLISFLINHHWTFTATGGYGRHFPRYVVVSAAGLVLNILIMYGAVALMKMSYLVGLTLVILTVPPASYTLQRYWTFRSMPKE